MAIERGKYKDLDTFTDILDQGGQLAAEQRRILIFLPLVMLAFAMMGFLCAPPPIINPISVGTF